jgi:AmmeMemoRadiSam system protein B
MLNAAAAPDTITTPKALIVPHAGYIYSGPVAATAYAALGRGARRIRRVVLLGPAHRAYIPGLALPDADAFATPIGTVPIDRAALAQIPWVPRSAAAHLREHSLEVQLPFLIRALGAFSLVPLAAGDAEPEEVARVLEALWGGPETLVVVSSDLSHYLPYQIARSVDAGTAQAILGLGASAGITHDHACGATPVNGLLLVARRRGLRPVLLDLRSSGDTAGGRAEVVGYGAFAFYEEEAPDAAAD